MEVVLPPRFTRHSMYRLLNEVIDNDLHPKAREIRFNFCDLSFIEPAGITILSNLFEWLRKQGVRSKVIYPTNINKGKNSPIQFLDDSMFFKQYIGKSITSYPGVRPTTIPLKLVAYSDSTQWLENDFTFWLSNQLSIPPNTLTTIRTCFGEIFNNIKDHAQENIGCIFAQHYPNKNQIKIAISDFGMGIPDNIRRIYPSLQDHLAIEKASEEGVTSKTSPRNLGAGLHTLIENVVNNNKGAIHIHSNYGIVSCIKGNDGVEKQATLERGFYPGTFIEVILRTDFIENITDFEEEFKW
ncbi:ATP-binding protein [Siminovitchia sp. FSL W7-1587]|uniref:ATP-binding protein n=1 Tax=Siminovitchia sp. FSL W7-1587 TaxID=2954699 RepID=UPI0030D3F043